MTFSQAQKYMIKRLHVKYGYTIKESKKEVIGFTWSGNKNIDYTILECNDMTKTMAWLIKEDRK